MRRYSHDRGYTGYARGAYPFSLIGSTSRSRPKGTTLTQQPFQNTQGFRGNSPEAGKARTASLVLGIVGLFLLGIILGPLAIMQANKAERLGERATAGKVLGYICTIFGVIGLIFTVLRFLG